MGSGASTPLSSSTTPHGRVHPYTDAQGDLLVSLQAHSTFRAATAIQTALRCKEARRELEKLVRESHAKAGTALVQAKGVCQTAETNLDRLSSTLDDIALLDMRIPFVRATTPSASEGLQRVLNYQPGHTVRVKDEASVK